MGDDSFAGLSVDQQLGLVGVLGVLLVGASYRVGSSVEEAYHPTLFGIGLVCVLYAGLRFGYERLR